MGIKRLQMPSLVLLALSVLLASAWESPLPPRDERLACPYYQSSGCILDQLEKACEGEGSEMMDPLAGENIWMCCCPEPYINCSKEEMDKACVAAIRGTMQRRGGGNLDLTGLLEVRSKLLSSQRSARSMCTRTKK